MSFGLDRFFWTPLLVVAALLAGWARMILRTPGQVQMGSELAAGAYLGGVLGSALMPWAAGVLAAYGYWLWNKPRHKADYMREVFPGRQRRLLHLVVLFFVLLMLLEAFVRAAFRLGLL